MLDRISGDDTRREGFLFGGLAFLVYALTASWGEPHFNDARGAAVAAWALATNGSVLLPASWGPDIDFWLVPAGMDAVASNRFPGVFIVAAPMYLLARLVGAVPGSASAPLEVPLWPATLTAVVMAAATIIAMHAVFLDLTSRAVAAVATVATAFGTALWSVSAGALWPHSASGLVLALLMRQLQRERWVGVALLSGVLPLIRPHLAIVPAVLCLAVLRRTGLRRVVPLAASTLLGVLILVGYSGLVFDSWIPAAGYDAAGHIGVARRGVGWFGEQFLAGAVGLPRGFLVHSTFLLVALPLVITGWRDAPPWTRWCAASGMAYLLAQVALVGSEGGGFTFGYRVQIETVLLLMPLVVATAGSRCLNDRRLAFAGSVAVVVAVAFHVAAVFR